MAIFLVLPEGEKRVGRHVQLRVALGHRRSEFLLCAACLLRAHQLMTEGSPPNFPRGVPLLCKYKRHGCHHDDHDYDRHDDGCGHVHAHDYDDDHDNHDDHDRVVAVDIRL